MKAFFQSLFLSNRLFLLLGIVASWFLLAFMMPLIMPLGQILLGLVLLLWTVDTVMLYQRRGGVEGRREAPDRLSNGDENEILVHLKSLYPFPVDIRLIDEIPPEFQRHDVETELKLEPGKSHSWSYSLRPVTRGEYHFGGVKAYVSSPLGLVQRRFSFDAETMIPCYPSYIQMREYQLMAISNRLTEVGVKKLRRLGHTTEFEQIKEYVQGDDYRTLNWKATARSNKLMVNQFADERSQQVYCLIDKSRVMRMPFEGMTLMDYAINATLVLSNITLYRSDKSGVITFAEKIHQWEMAQGRPIQMQRITEMLYNQETEFQEASYEALYTFVKRKLSQRALLLLFTNFETVSALRRQLPYLQALNRQHLLVVIFFENTELRAMLNGTPHDVEEIYLKATGEDFAYQKRLIARELSQHGILSVLTPPNELTVQALNQYLAIKSRGLV